MTTTGATKYQRIGQRLEALVAESEADSQAMQQGKLALDEANERSLTRSVSLTNISYWLWWQSEETERRQ